MMNYWKPYKQIYEKNKKGELFGGWGWGEEGRSWVGRILSN